MVEAKTVGEALLVCVEAAVQLIRETGPTEKQIHGARKNLKRARADLRLLRDAIGKTAYIRENTALRDAARALSGVRDAAVLSKTADKLLTRARPGERRRLLLKVRHTLEQGCREAQAELQAMNALNESAACLEAAIARMRRWKLTQAHSASICKGLERTYRRGRKAFAHACEKPTDENLHEWRKQVKYLGQSLEVWRALRGHDGEGLVKRADKLADLLGSDHDLVVFEQRLEMLDAPHSTQPAISHDIADQRRGLLKKALKKGRRIFKAKPRSFVRKIAR